MIIQNNLLLSKSPSAAYLVTVSLDVVVRRKDYFLVKSQSKYSKPWNNNNTY